MLRPLLLAAVFWPGMADGQGVGTVLGRITDVTSGGPLSGVFVLVVPAGPEVVSGEEGWYFLTGIPEGRWQIELSRLGYAAVAESIQVVGGDAYSLDFQLRPEAIPLEELIVSVEEGAAGSLGHRTVVRGERLEERRANTMTELIQGLVPGVILTNPSGQVGAAGDLRIRGIRSLQDARPLFFVDGVRVGSAQTAGPPGTSQILDFLNSIHPRDVDRIEVVRNPEATLLFGSDARGGVILIFTKKGSLRTLPVSIPNPADRLDVVSVEGLVPCPIQPI